MSNIALENPIVKGLLQSLTKSDRIILEKTIWSAIHFSKIYFSHDHVAWISSVNVKTVQRAFRRLCALGLIKRTFRRGWNITSIYKLSTFFLDCAHVLRHVFRPLQIVYMFKLNWYFKSNPKSNLSANFIKMSTYNSIISINYYQEPVVGYDDCQFLETDNQILKNNPATEEVEQIFGQQSEGEVMDIDIPLTKTMEEVRDTLDLNHWGEIKISPFPDEALSDTLAQLKHANPRNTVKWFVDTCVLYCKNNSLHVNWADFYRLRDKYNMPSSPVYVKKNKTVAHQSQSRSPYLTLEPEVPKEERDAVIVKEYMHFETEGKYHSDDELKKVEEDMKAGIKPPRKKVHPYFAQMQNPFLERYNNIREERGIEKLPEKETISWSMFKFEVKDSPKEKPVKPQDKTILDLDSMPVSTETVSTETVGTGPVLEDMVHIEQLLTEQPPVEQPYMSDDSPWEEI